MKLVSIATGYEMKVGQVVEHLGRRSGKHIEWVKIIGLHPDLGIVSISTGAIRQNVLPSSLGARFKQPHGQTKKQAAKMVLQGQTDTRVVRHAPNLQQVPKVDAERTAGMNHLQKALSEVYDGGEFAGATTWIPGAVGDRLYDFLMSELGNDCLAEAADYGKEPEVVAMERILRARARLTLAYDQLAKS